MSQAREKFAWKNLYYFASNVKNKIKEKVVEVLSMDEFGELLCNQQVEDVVEIIDVRQMLKELKELPKKPPYNKISEIVRRIAEFIQCLDKI